MLYVTLPADSILYDINVYFDPLFSPDSVRSAIIERLSEFRFELPFDGVFFVSDFLSAVLAVPGVKTAKVNSISGTQGETTEEIDVSYEVVAGYFNFSEDVVINMINING